eukprot:symbB.v1.2.027960.t1/scaffold2908.1/size67487/3
MKCKAFGPDPKTCIAFHADSLASDPSPLQTSRVLCTCLKAMPLVEIFAKEADMPKIQAAELCHFLQEHFGVEPGVVQVMMSVVKDLAPEPVYLSLRAKGTPPRREKVNELLAGIGKYLESKGLSRGPGIEGEGRPWFHRNPPTPAGKIRIELFEPSQQAVHSWGSSKL